VTPIFYKEGLKSALAKKKKTLAQKPQIVPEEDPFKEYKERLKN
jgi:hypothetical protein